MKKPTTGGLSKTQLGTRTFNCKIHGGYQGFPVPNFLNVSENGRYLDPVCPDCDQDRVDRIQESDRAEIARRRQLWVEKQIGVCGIHRRFRGKTLENYTTSTHEQRAALAVAERYLSTLQERVYAGDCLIFCGGPGTGKSHIATAIVSEAIRNYLTSAYLTVTDLVLIARSTYHKKSATTLREELTALSRLDLLVIDEVGQQVGREDQWLLFHVIDTRYREKKPTILISNLDIPGLTAYVGERVIDRFAEGSGVIVPFNWPSYRV